MVGEPIILDWRTWLRGMSSGTELDDGGFSPDTEGVNLISEPGVVFAPAAGVDSDTDTVLSGSGEIQVTSEDHDNFLGSDRLVMAIDANEDGFFVRYNGTKLVALSSPHTDSTRDYGIQVSDMISFQGKTYYTSKTHIGEWSGTETFNDTFDTFTDSDGRPHPALTFENHAYFGDGNELRRLASGGSSAEPILTLLNSSEIITALGIDPGTGKMLIATTDSLAIAGTLSSINRLMWYDGQSDSVAKSVLIGDPIYSFHSVGSTVYVGCGRTIARINGSGIEWLRDLKNTTYASDELPYKQKLTSIGNTLYVADGDQVLAYGPVPGAGFIWRYALQNKVNSNKFDCIFPAGNGAGSDTRRIGFSMSSEKFYTLDLTDTSTLDKFFLMTNWTYFPRPVTITNLQLEFFSDLASTGNLSVTAYDSERDTHTIASLDGAITSRKVIRKMGGFPKRVDAIRFQVENATTNAGLKRMLIYRTPLE